MFYHKTLRNSDGTALRARRNGATKTWKTRPGAFRVPVKHGLRKCFYIEPGNAGDWLTYDPLTMPARLGLPSDAPAGIVRDAMKDAGLIPQ